MKPHVPYALAEFVYVIPYGGDPYPLFGGSRAVLSLSGFGLSPHHHITERGPNKHGTKVVGYRQDPREITLTVHNSSKDRTGYWVTQGELSDLLRPNRGGNAWLLVILPDGTEREIEVVTLTGNTGAYNAQSSQLASDVVETVRLLAPSPWWRDPTPHSVNTSLVGGACLPMCLPWCVGSNVIDVTFDIPYVGTWESYPTIEIVGPITNPTITNLVTSEVLSLGYVVPAGVVVTIILGEDIDRVYNNLGDDLIGTVLYPSDFATFHLAPSPVAPGGVNPLRIVGSGGSSGLTSVSLEYYDNYNGVPR